MITEGTSLHTQQLALSNYTPQFCAWNDSHVAKPRHLHDYQFLFAGNPYRHVIKSVPCLHLHSCIHFNILSNYCHAHVLFSLCLIFFFYVLLTVQYLSIFILVNNQLDAQNLFYNKFISCLYMFRASCAHRQEAKNFTIQPLVSSHL
jgi:hypothetical protein